MHPLVGPAFHLANSPLDVATGLNTSMCKLVCPLYDFALSGGGVEQRVEAPNNRVDFPRPYPLSEKNGHPKVCAVKG